tara:strand:- start:695 stop:1393 length:699 start_codon:yes stop_codon:yes gene_type:complete
MARTKLPQRPGAPSEPRSFLLPVAALLALLFVGVAYPALSAAEHEEEEAEAETPAEPDNATLTVRTTPEGATVRAGDEECTAPCDLELPADEELTVRITKEGFRAVEHELTPTAGMDPLDVNLEAAPFVLAVTAPEGATVWVNGEEASDPSAIELGDALAQPVAVEVRQRGFRSYTTEVAADAFTAEDARRFHQVEVSELERAGRSPRRAAAPAAAPAPAPEPEGPVPNNPF